MKSLCVLIPVYNKLEYTRKCLSDLKANLGEQLSIHVKIVVIDDGSKDGTGEWVHEHYPEVTVLQGTGSLFWTGAMNIGMKYAFLEEKSEYVLLWNNDVMIKPDYFNSLFAVLQSKPLGMVGSKIMTLADESIVWSFGGYFDPRTGKKGMYGYFEKDGGEYSTIRSVDWCTGMGTLIHHHVMDKIGMMDEKSFPQYFGDTDYSYRAKLAGLPIIINPDLVLFNDTVNTGLRAQNGFRELVRSLTDIRSNLNMKCNYTFIGKYATSKQAYITMSLFYLRVIGGYFKWKILSVLGFSRSTDRYYKAV